MWFGTLGGASRFDGKEWRTYTHRDGLRPDRVNALAQDRTGSLWFGTFDGVSRFDGERWINFGRRTGFDIDNVNVIFQDRDGAMWFGGGAMRPGRGVIRFDGREWRVYTQAEGLAADTVAAIFQDKDGAMWFGTGDAARPGAGVSRLDGETWQTYTEQDGLANNTVLSIFQDRRGAMWFGTHGGGVSRFDDGGWTTYTKDDGLGSNYVSAILQDSTGVMWFGTLDGGVSRYDGKFFQTIDSRDGLPNDTITCLYMDRSKAIWAGTLGGAVHFLRPLRTQPPLSIDRVIADDRAYRPINGVQDLPAGVKRVAFHFHAVSFKTRPGGMRYSYQMVGRDADWQKPTNAEAVEYFNLKPGRYTFQVQAIDRDLNASEFATVRINIPAAFQQTAGFRWMVGGATASLLFILLLLIVAFIKHRIRIRDYQQMLRQELRDAREMQMSLLPHSTPVVDGFDIAGICEPAAEVGGDCFTYLWLGEAQKQLGIVLMDVTGHGMKAAATTFLANGMLRSEAQSERRPDRIMTKMHRSLQEALPKNAFVAMGFALIDCPNKTLTHFNAGLAEPILLRESQSVDLLIQSAVPLGCRLPAEYAGITLPLKSGDTLVFFSDGLLEAINKKGEIYGEARMMDFLRACSAGSALLATSNTHSAQAWVEAIRADLHTFLSPATPTDDMTLVVVKVL
jgi:serine phosphatase RsbU (regulator of sigma subunit)